MPKNQMRKKKETLKHYKEQGNPEDQAKEYLDEEEVNNMLSFKYDNPALWRKLSEDKIKDIVKNISYVDIQKLYFTTSKVVYKSQISASKPLVQVSMIGKTMKKFWRSRWEILKDTLAAKNKIPKNVLENKENIYTLCGCFLYPY
ncbi:hypothetical protein FQA39_LY00774 [Lamprigera yunnana]|nr:hypothetical protein FQA39_LY00774 [Lamprigera yunnana]